MQKGTAQSVNYKLGCQNQTEAKIWGNVTQIQRWIGILKDAFQ